MKNLRELHSLYRFFSSSKVDKILISSVLFLLFLSYVSNAPILAQIAGTATFALFLKVVISTMKENAREAERKNPDFDHDSEVFTRSTLYMGLVLIFSGLPMTLIGITGLFSLGNLPEENVGLSVLIEIFWTPFAFLLSASVGLGLQYMGLYSCWRYFTQ